MSKVAPGIRIPQRTWVTIAYPLTCKLAEGLEMAPKKVVRQLGNVCILPATQVSQSRVEIRDQQCACRS